jgi:Protein of unknown function (DUF1153)
VWYLPVMPAATRTPNFARLLIRTLLRDWICVIRRKAEVAAAVRGDLLSLEEACSRYTLSVDKFLVWHCSIDRHGFAGLRTL